MAKPSRTRQPTTAAAVAIPRLVASSVISDLLIIPPYMDNIANAPEIPQSTYMNLNGSSVVVLKLFVSINQKWDMKMTTAMILNAYTATSQMW